MGVTTGKAKTKKHESRGGFCCGLGKWRWASLQKKGKSLWWFVMNGDDFILKRRETPCRLFTGNYTNIRLHGWG